MTREIIRTNYCLEDLVIFWMTKTQKIWICCLKQIGFILTNEKTKYEVVMDPTSDSKTIRKKQNNETRLFYKNTCGRTVWFKCTISMYYFKRTGIFSNNDPLTPIFCIIWSTLKILTNHYFHPLFQACYQVQFKKNLTNKTERMYLLKKLGKILLNGKSIERKDRFVSKTLQHSPEW